MPQYEQQLLSAMEKGLSESKFFISFLEDTEKDNIRKIVSNYPTRYSVSIQEVKYPLANTVLVSLSRLPA